MGDQEGVATQLAALLQRLAVLTTIGAALAPFLAGALPATFDEGAARSHSRPKGRKGGGGPAQPPPPPPTAEQAMIASLQGHIASLQGVINTLRRELAESRGEPPPARSLATAPARAATMTTTTMTTTTTKSSTLTKTATANKAAASTSRAARVWQLAGRDPNRCPTNAQAQQAATAP